MNKKNIRVSIVAENGFTKFGAKVFLPLNYFKLLREPKIETWLFVCQRTQSELESVFANECDRMYFVTDNWIHRLRSQLGEFLPN